MTQALDGSLSRRDRWIALIGLVGVTGLGWGYLLRQSQGMGMEAAMPQMQADQAFDPATALAMWIVMMIAMMLPSATPAILLFAAISRRAEQPLRLAIPAFTSGYLVGWAAFSLLATLAQWALHSAAFLLPDMSIVSRFWGGVVLLAAGLFQWTPLKRACLTNCRSPQSLFMTEWRNGLSGAIRMGLKHSGYCVGCCWSLMTLLFVVGSMNLVWVAVIAAFVLVEKLIPSGQWVSRFAGILLGACGLWLILQSPVSSF